LTERLDISGIQAIKQGTLWQISVERGNIEEIIKYGIISTDTTVFDNYNPTHDLTSHFRRFS